jgi:hypothetical protein
MTSTFALPCAAANPPCEGLSCCRSRSSGWTGAVVVLLNAGNQFEVDRANGVWSRIPQRIANLLRDPDPPTGPRPTRFFIILDTLVALAVVAQAWTFLRIARRRLPPSTPRLLAAAPLAWELVAAPLILVGYPPMVGGFGWGAAFSGPAAAVARPSPPPRSATGDLHALSARP